MQGRDFRFSSDPHDQLMAELYDEDVRYQRRLERKLKMGDNEGKTKQLTFDTGEELLEAISAVETLDFDYAVERRHSEEDLTIIYLLIIYLED